MKTHNLLATIVIAGFVFALLVLVIVLNRDMATSVESPQLGRVTFENGGGQR